MNIFQNPILFNSFYYPNFAFVLLPYFFLLQFVILIIPPIIIFKHRHTILSWLSKDYIFSILIILLVVVMSRIIVMFFNSSHIQILPEKIFAMNMVGRDWLDSVMGQVMSLWQGLPFDKTLVYGKGFIVFFGILLYPLFKTGICSPNNLINCSQTVYLVVSASVLISYIVLICCCFRSLIRNVLLIGFATFILGYAGSLGLERGNIDILFSLIILTLYLFRKHKTNSSWLSVFVEASILGLLCSSKITMVPLALAFVFTSQRLGSSFLYLIFWYGVWSLSPVIFGIHNSILDSYVAATMYQKVYYSDTLSASCQLGNYGLIGLASLFISCSSLTLNIFNKLFLVIVYFVYAVLFVVVFIIPLRPLISQLRMMNKKMVWCIESIYKNRGEFILFLLTLAVAGINLLPVASAASYRLYFSFSVLVAAWYSITSVKAKHLLLFSTMCFLLKGVWFTEIKLLNILVVLHYLALISASSIDLADMFGTKRRLA